VLSNPKFAELREALTGKRTYSAPCTITSVEKRANGGLTISGYAAVFDSPSKPICGMFIEYIKRGAFRKALASPNLDVVLLVNHEGLPYSRTTNGSLRLEEDARGLKFSADIIDTTDGLDLHKRVDAGLLTKMSFAFSVARDEWVYGDDESKYSERYIWEFEELYDVSVVTDPAYDDTETAPDSTGEDNMSKDDPQRSVTTMSENRDSDGHEDVVLAQESDSGMGVQRTESGDVDDSTQASDKDAQLIRSWQIKSLSRSRTNESCT